MSNQIDIATARMVTVLARISDESTEPHIRKMAYGALSECQIANSNSAANTGLARHRFRVFESGGLGDRQKVFSAGSTMECYTFLKAQDMGLNSYIVDDVEDDIEVDGDDFVQAFDEGERYEDLQGF